MDLLNVLMITSSLYLNCIEYTECEDLKIRMKLQTGLDISKEIIIPDSSFDPNLCNDGRRIDNNCLLHNGEL